ncbi:transcriptional regulator [Brachymonas wangyanguii]|uniref:transcriptional regulator n=1 Tax=Brachymonas wangyanguii TaxID=3130163 RepID=UPI00307D39FA
MNLLEHLKSLGPEGSAKRIDFSATCETSERHLTNIAYGYKPCGIPLAVSIERATSGAVTRQDLRPDDYWRIWPDLEAPANVQQEGGHA